ncbi:hypothetical protein VPH35_040036 [Triticum aestivum]
MFEEIRLTKQDFGSRSSIYQASVNSRHRSKSSILCCVHHGEDKEQRFQIKSICNFGVVTLEAVLNSNGGLFVDARPMMPAKE